MKTPRWSQGMALRAWNSPKQVRRRQMVSLAVIISFPVIVLPICLSEWFGPNPSFDKWVGAIGYTFSIFSAVAFVATVGRWAFWCMIDIVVSWWNKPGEPKGKSSWRRHSVSTTWWGV